MKQWRVFWVPDAATRSGAPSQVMDDWEGFARREESARVRPGDPIFLSPEYRVDPLLTRYVQSRSFGRHTRETRRNYASRHWDGSFERYGRVPTARRSFWNSIWCRSTPSPQSQY